LNGGLVNQKGWKLWEMSVRVAGPWAEVWTQVSSILSLPRSGVTYKWMCDFGLDTYTTYNSWLRFTVVLLQILIITVYIALLLFQAVRLYFSQSAVHYTHWVLLVCCPALVLKYRFPTAYVPLPEFLNCPRSTATLYSQCCH
jgi:hypothetical protein